MLQLSYSCIHVQSSSRIVILVVEIVPRVAKDDNTIKEAVKSSDPSIILSSRIVISTYCITAPPTANVS